MYHIFSYMPTRFITYVLCGVVVVVVVVVVVCVCVCVCERDNENDNVFIEFGPSAQSQGGDKILSMFILVLHTSCGGAHTRTYSLSHSHTNTH